MISRAGTTSIGGWLVTVVRNWCLDRLRQNREEHMRAEIEPVTGSPTPGSTLVALDMGAALWHAVGALPPLERAAVLLRYRDGLSYQDIAQRMGKSGTHVGVLLHQAMGRLRGVAALRQEVEV